MLKKIKVIWNVGLSKDEYSRLELPVAQMNMKTLQWVSLLTGILMFGLVAVILFPFFSSLTMNRNVYLMMGIFSLPVFGAALILLPKHPGFVKPLFYLFLFMVIAFSIHIGVYTNTDQRASTICVLLLAIPLLITDKPHRITLFLSLSVLLFCAASYHFKDHELFVADFVNCFCIFLISVAVNFAQQNMKYRSINDRYIIEENNIQLIHRQELELEESRISIMLSQIQPHFLYNALTAIARLCDLDPAKAKKTTLDFSDYLRGNLDSLSQKQPVLFSTELKHTRVYTDIEQIRFGDKLRVVYDIQAEDFLLPSLTVQPLVENAVKYGVGKKEGGGTVRLSTRADHDGSYITIADDGVGFDPIETRDDGRTHIGIDNVRRRLGLQCGGTLTLKSSPGSGTTAEVFIPRGGKANDDSLCR